MLASTRVRPARDSDAKAVVALLEADDLEVAFDPREFLVAEEDGRVVACARLRPLAKGAHELASVAVARERRGAGIGARLVRDALARAEGAVYALALAPGFFAKQGFTPLLVLPAELQAKAAGACASKPFTAMRYARTPDIAVQEIRARYAEAAEGDACCAPYAPYDAAQLAALPREARLSLGTGNPVREARLAEGDIVVDLGSGGGIDVLLAAMEVGPRGRAIGIDFTPEMLAKARANAAKAGVANAEFHEAPIERLPLADGIADAVISNCVINLSVDKLAVLREARRVLKDGGRFVVSDTLRLADAPATDAPSCDCVTGALSEAEWRALLASAGFEGIDVEPGPPMGDVGTATVRAWKPITVQTGREVTRK